MLIRDVPFSVRVVLSHVVPFLQVECLQLTRYGFTVQVAEHSEASFTWNQINLQINGKRDWKSNGLLHLNQFVQHNLIAPGIPSVHLPAQMVCIVAFAIKATIGIRFSEFA